MKELCTNRLRERERERGERREEGGPCEMKRERMKNDVDKTWQPSGGRNHKTVHLSGNSAWCHNLDIEKGGATI